MLSEAACAALREEVLLEAPLVISDVATPMYNKRTCMQKNNLCLDLSVSYTDINWDSLTANKNGEIQPEWF